MKKFTKFILALAIITPFLFSGCQKNEIPEEDIKVKEEVVFPYKSSDLCGEAYHATLTDWDETVNAGSFIVGNDESNFYATFDATEDWEYLNTALYVGPASQIPAAWIDSTGFTGVFYPEQFQYETSHSPWITHYTYTHDLSLLDDCFAVIGVVKARNKIDGSIWIFTAKSNLKTLGFYFEYCKQDCEGSAPPLGCPKLAFAHDDATAICFKDIKRNGTLNPDGNGTWTNFWLWGWTNGGYDAGTYELDLWAGSDGCTPSSGFLVGSVTIDYDGSSADVSYDLNPAYELKATYVYVGEKILPKKWRRYRVAPLFYPKKHYHVNSSTDSFTINNLSGAVHFAAGAIVKDAE